LEHFVAFAMNIVNHLPIELRFMKRIITLLLLLFIPAAVTAEPLVIHAVGDIMLAGSGEKTYRKSGYDYPFDATRKRVHRQEIPLQN